MVQLRVDVEAARARTEFNSASRTVEGFRGSLTSAQRAADELADELRVADARLAQATREFEAAERAADGAADEVRRLQVAVAAAGANPPAALTRELRNAEQALQRAEREEQRLREGMERTAQEANRVSRAFNDAGDEVGRITRQLVAANVEADRLRREMDRVQRSADNPLRGAQRGLIGFRQQLDGLLSQSPGRGLSDAIGNAWRAMPAELKLVVIGVGAALAATFVAAIGASVNALLLAGVGGAIVAGMVAIAAKTSNVVQKAFRDLFEPIKNDAINFAAVAEGPLVSAANSLGDAWRDVREDVRGAFADAAPLIADLGVGLGGLVRNVMPGLRSALTAAGPVLKELANDLPALGDAISRMFTELSRGGEGAAKGMRFLIQFISGALIAFGTAVGFLTRQFDILTAGAEGVLTGLAKIPLLGKAFQPAAEFFQQLNNVTDRTSRSLDGTGRSADSAALGMGRVADATQRATDAARRASDAFGEELNKALGLSNAHVQAEAAIDAVTESFKANGRSLDANTEKGRNNITAINQTIAALEAQRKAEIESGVAIDVANAHYAAQVDRLRALLGSLGLTKAQVDALISSLRALPTGEKQLTYRVKVIEEGGSNVLPRPGLAVARASGGPVSAGQLYRVGERGEEWFVPGQNGTIIPTDAVQRLKRQMAETRAPGRAAAASPVAGTATAVAAPVYNISVSAPTGSTPADVGKAVVESIKAYERTSGKGWRLN